MRLRENMLNYGAPIPILKRALTPWPFGKMEGEGSTVSDFLSAGNRI